MADKTSGDRPRRAFIQIPPNWNDLTEEEQQAASLEMARALQRQLLPRSPEPPEARDIGGEVGTPMRPRATGQGRRRPQRRP